jgi:hypothetical protein
MILGMFAALALGLSGFSVPAQDIDPAVAAAEVAKAIGAPKEVEAGVWIRDSHAEGPLVILGFEAAAEVATIDWVSEFVSGMCAPEYKAAMDRLFDAGMRVRPDLIAGGKRTQGTVIERCPG